MFYNNAIGKLQALSRSEHAIGKLQAQALQFVANGHPHPAQYAKILLAIGKGC